MAVAWQFLFDRLELEQQVVAEGAHQAETRIFRAAKLLNERAQNGECRGCLERSSSENSPTTVSCSGQEAIVKAQFVPMRMAGQQRME